METSKNKDREYYLKNKERLNEYSRQAYAKNREERKAYAREYYRKNKDNAEFVERSKEIRKKSYIKNLDKKSEYQRKLWNNIKIETLRSISETIECKRCGFDNIIALQIDHIDGGGKKHMETFSSNKKYMEFVKLNPSMFQILCANCNFIKRYENREFRKSSHAKD